MPDVPAIAIREFPIRGVLTPVDGGYETLFSALATALQLPPEVRLRGSTVGWERPDSGPDLQGGLRLLEVRRRGGVVSLVVSFAGFDADGFPRAWSQDHSRPWSGPPIELRAVTGTPDAPATLPEDAVKRARRLAREHGRRKPPRASPRLTSPAPLRRVLLSPDATRCASIGTDDVLRFWDTETGEQTARAKIKSVPGRWAQAMAFSPEGDRLVAGMTRLTIFDVARGRALTRLDGHPRGQVLDLAWCGDAIASTSESVRGVQSNVTLWRASTGKALAGWSWPSPNCVRFESDGSALVVASARGVHRATLTGRLDAPVQSWADAHYAQDLARLEDGWACSKGPRVTILDPTTWEVRRTVHIPGVSRDAPLPWRVPIATDATGTLIAAAGFDNQQVALAEARSGEVLKRFRLPTDLGARTPEIESIDLSPDGRLLVAAVGDTVAIWNTGGDIRVEPRRA